MKIDFAIKSSHGVIFPRRKRTAEVPVLLPAEAEAPRIIPAAYELTVGEDENSESPYHHPVHAKNIRTPEKYFKESFRLF